jgi:hypothetical protein
MAAERDAETLLATILDGIGQPFYAVDRNWRDLSVQSRCGTAFRPSAEQMIGTISGRISRRSRRRDAADPARRHGAARDRPGETMSLVGRYVS